MLEPVEEGPGQVEREVRGESVLIRGGGHNGDSRLGETCSRVPISGSRVKSWWRHQEFP